MSLSCLGAPADGNANSGSSNGGGGKKKAWLVSIVLHFDLGTLVLVKHGISDSCISVNS